MENNIERWRKVKDFENYLVSTMGRLYNKTNKRYIYGNLNNYGYIRVDLRKDGKGTKKYMHVLVAIAFIPNPSNLPMVDHHDTDRSNNKLVNLRWASSSQNGMNKKKRMGTSSKFKGVCWKKKANKWEASIKVNQVKMYLGLFTDEDEAGRAYNTKAKEIFGLFALLNDIPDKIPDEVSDDSDSETDYEFDENDIEIDEKGFSNF
jgi:hypothetical protein